MTSTQDCRAELAAVVASAEFVRAPQMIRLLDYLVAQSLCGNLAGLSEEAIGLAVFGRDPVSYHPYDDPIVRVQTGRLRVRLSKHYDGSGNRRAFRIVLPVKSYQPVLQAQRPTQLDFTNNYLLALQPVRCIGSDPAARSFAEGLSEELADALFRHFGSQIVSPGFAAESRSSGAVSHVLEGSLRVHDEQLRATFRLVDAAAGSIAWSAQFERAAALTLNVERHLATEVCAALRQYYCQS